MPAHGRDIAVVLMRGGTSKGVFVRDEHLPPRGAQRDAFLLSLMGSPDAAQIDGLGGATSSTSKVVSVSVSDRADCDLDYTFYQVGIDRPVVDHRGNCGNLTAAVAPFAIDEGLFRAAEAGAVDIRLYNLNTDRRIDARVPVRNGKFAHDGDYALDGVPGTGAPIVTDYLDPEGAVTGALFPAGAPRIRLTPHVGEPIDATIVDVTAPVVMVTADDLGIDADADPVRVNGDPALLARIESIRAAAAVAAGLTTDESDALARSPALPRVAILSPARRHLLASGRVIEIHDHDLVVRSTSMQRAHHAIPLTTAMCVAAASALPGTVAHSLRTADGEQVRLAHPKGIAPVLVRLNPRGSSTAVAAVGVIRTARRLLSGVALVEESSSATP